VIGAIAAAALLVVVIGWLRHRATRKQAAEMLLTREDRTASFSRRPGRLKGSGLL